MNNVYLDQIAKVVGEIERLIGNSFPLEILIERVAQWRGKPIKVESDLMPLGMTGYIVPLKDCDLICYKQNLDLVRRNSVVLHEIAHLLLGHIPSNLDVSTFPTYRQFRRARDHKYIYCRRMTGQDDAEKEKYTELLSSILLEYIVRGEILYSDVFDFRG